MGLDRSGEIDYYEELGVDRNATQDEIRDSFRSLVRLLHPDHQQDETLKTIAEKQLRKLNRTYAVLSDPERRRRYDLSREGELRPPTIVFSPTSSLKARELIARILWSCAALLGVGMVIWLATDAPSAPVFSEPRQVNATSKTAVQAAPPLAEPESESAALHSPQIPGGDDVSQLRAALRTARAERDEAQRELAELKDLKDKAGQEPDRKPLAEPAMASAPTTAAPSALTDPVLPRPVPPTTVRPMIASAPAPNPAPPARTAKLPGAEARQFAGFWFFTKSPQPNRNRNLYYPEFIEATLTEQNGVIHGRYRSRYQIVDRAISPDVNFEFSGTPSNGAIVCPWTGPGGAKGQLTVRMVGDNDMKVDWTASEIGSVQGLASGTATLTRRIE